MVYWGGFGTWLGYVIGIFLIQKYGFRVCFKAAFGLWVMVSLATAVIAGHIAEWFVLLAVLKAIPGGMYAANCDAIMLSEFKTDRRNNFLQFVLGFEFLVSVLLPALIGALVRGAAGYRIAFVLAAGIYSIGLLMPLSVPSHRLRLRLRETRQLFQRPYYRRHATNRMTASGFNQLNAFVIMILPFLLLKDEFKVGLLASLTALLAGLMSLVMRRVKHQKRLRIGYGAYTIRAIASVLFVVYWTTPLFMVWQLVTKFVTPLHDPLQQGLDTHNDSLILGKDLKTKALHINLVNNTLQLMGTTVAYGTFFVMTRLAGGQPRYILQLLIMGYAAWRFVNLAVSARINVHIQRPVFPRVLVHEVALSKRYAAQLVVRSHLMRLRAFMP